MKQRSESPTAYSHLLYAANVQCAEVSGATTNDAPSLEEAAEEDQLRRQMTIMLRPGQVFWLAAGVDTSTNKSP